MKFSFFLSILKSTNDKYAYIEPELYARILVSLLEGTMLKLKLERKQDAKDDFLKFFDKMFTSMNKPQLS